MQTLSYSHHLKLLKIPWIILKGKTNDVYYIKAHYDDTEYKILVTDLKYVWYEHGNSILIMRRAENYRMEIETKEQIKTLICSLRNCFEQSKNCFPTLIENKLVIEYNESIKGFTSLSWSFHCLPLEITIDSKNDDKFLDGPRVLYMHFILPMLMVTQSESMKSNEIAMTENNILQSIDCLNKLPEASEQLIYKSEHDINNDNDETRVNEINSAINIKNEQQTMTSNEDKKLIDSNNELKRRAELNLNLLKRREKGKKKKRLF